MELVKRHRFTPIDVDYESLPPFGRQATTKPRKRCLDDQRWRRPALPNVSTESAFRAPASQVGTTHVIAQVRKLTAHYLPSRTQTRPCSTRGLLNSVVAP